MGSLQFETADQRINIIHEYLKFGAATVWQLQVARFPSSIPLVLRDLCTIGALLIPVT